MKHIIIAIAVIVSTVLSAQAQCDPTSVFSNTTTNAVCISVEGAIRTVYSNALPDHETGAFPNPGNPNSIKAQRITLTMCSQPRLAPTKTILDQGSGSCPFWVFGVGINGLEFDPIANEFFRNTSTGQLNRSWNLNALSPNVKLGLDMNQAHVQPTGKYHYHGSPTKFIESLNVSSTAHSPIIGYAADGFPMYYRYVYEDPTGASKTIVDATSCHRLKDGMRPGDGVSAPNGAYDGTYTQDYEYLTKGDCLLDECNGRFGVTPDYPSGTYYYVMTETYPVIPRCLSGYPDKAFTIGPPQMGCATSSASQICTVSGIEGDPIAIMEQIEIAPNPVRSVLTLRFLSSDIEHHVTAIRIFNAEGREMIAQKNSAAGIDTASLPDGTYYARVNVAGTEITKVFVKH
ncbi:MAG: YHYH protein [Ignavibacteria bacterium]|nr:YHYH protein [Ignavibacteria bacterium]MBK6419800.1 YHYH protein [Ignavibacteria bacterium]MBK6759569.1 YHYH protein [Ignavibacteria bacterium]MBK7184459.1 YHYH protein [Ignavibacteria bacterium]MBK7413263.1 YHYH protein [Ignavibacteria bacterium]